MIRYELFFENQEGFLDFVVGYGFDLDTAKLNAYQKLDLILDFQKVVWE